MTPSPIKNSLNYQTCLCCMCRCGDHQCYQQLASKLPLSMQKELMYHNREGWREKDEKERPHQADLYSKTIYRQDYCENPEIIDQFPLEHMKYPDNVKLNSTFAYPAKDSLYKDDFIPWSRRDQELCRAKLHIPDRLLERKPPRSGRRDVARSPTQREYYYYCPPHCFGNEIPAKKENCLLGHERQFNLGPPVRRTCPMTEKSPHPFAKYSNYMLDYKGSKIPAKRRSAKRSVPIEKSQYTMSSATTYKDAFSWPQETKIHELLKGPLDNLTVGVGLMVQETTSMHDYKDPDVSAHMPERHPRHVYQPPTCSMQTTTTTGSTYKRTKDLPVKVKPLVQKYEDTSFTQHETDVRRLMTTYQEDFDGIKSALCPCRVAEKYGPRVLEPVYSFRKSRSLHDMFCVNDRGTRCKICTHG